jgi:pilus assembly protein CpaF
MRTWWCCRLTPEQKGQMIGIIMREAVGFGPLDPQLKDPPITGIMVNAVDDIYIERDGKMLRSRVKFDDISQMMNAIRRMAATVGRRVDESSPMVDARLPDGSRFNAVIPPRRSVARPSHPASSAASSSASTTSSSSGR